MDAFENRHEETEPQLTAGEDVRGGADEEGWAPSQGADQSADAAEDQEDQAEREHHHHGTVHICVGKHADKDSSPS